MNQKNSKEHLVKMVCGTAALLLAVVILLIGSFAYITKYKISDIDCSTSPNGEYEVLYQSVGEPDWPFGYSHARFVLKHDVKTVTKCRFDVANDGAILHADSWSVIWKENSVEVTISGEEQPDELYTLYFDGGIERICLETKNK